MKFIIAIILISSSLQSSTPQKIELKETQKHWIIQKIDNVMEPYLPKNNLDNDDLPPNCSHGSKNNCAVCNDGFYRAKDPKSPEDVLCFSCDPITNCRLCRNADDKKLEKGAIECINCGFPRMPNQKLDACVGRKLLLVYFIAYCSIAIVLGILSFVESQKLKKVAANKVGSMLQRQLLSAKEDEQSNPEMAMDVDEED